MIIKKNANILVQDKPDLVIKTYKKMLEINPVEAAYYIDRNILAELKNTEE
ncbi:hypothetical protein ACFLUV_02810 [Elusimicrobiota bacterium]